MFCNLPVRSRVRYRAKLPQIHCRGEICCTYALFNVNLFAFGAVVNQRLISEVCFTCLLKWVHSTSVLPNYQCFHLQLFLYKFARLVTYGKGLLPLTPPLRVHYLHYKLMTVGLLREFLWRGHCSNQASHIRQNVQRQEQMLQFIVEQSTHCRFARHHCFVLHTACEAAARKCSSHPRWVAALPICVNRLNSFSK